MTQIPSEMNALLGSRICHDLISPLGAIGNGLELLQMSGTAASEEVSLIADAVAHANARIRLFRIAFGAAETGQAVAWAELAPIVAQVGTHRGLSVTWWPEAAVDRPLARLGTLLLLCAETLLPHGGDVRLEVDEALIGMILTADRMRDEAALLAQLTDTEAELPTASAIHFALARHAAAGLGRGITVERQEATLTILA